MESINDALIECVKALGGSKVVGPALWPEKAPDAAQRLLLDCLNPDRPAHLTPEHVVLLMRKARQAGHHLVADWLMSELGYAKPVPIEPRDEVAELQRQFIQATQDMATMMERMQSLQAQMAARPTLRAAA